MLKLDKKTISYFEEKGSKRIKVFFYNAGCSGNKVDISDKFEITDDLIKIPLLTKEGLEVGCYIKKKDKEKFESCSITRVVKVDHTGKEKIRYIFSSEKVEERCGCGTSFAFQKKVPKVNLDKLKNLKSRFKRI